MMKKKILKALAVAVCAILLVVGSVAGTLAYLTAKTDPITNTFTAGNVSITMSETVVDLYGTPVEDAQGKTSTTTEGNRYKLIPGHEYTKNPTVKVAEGSEDCWIFVRIENGLGADATITMDAANWTKISGTDVWYCNEVAKAGDSKTPFEKFTLSTTANVTDLAGKTIVVTAYAIQADKLTTATAAWEAAPDAWKTNNNG